ncbi:lactosylceramide 4-alpha-galactosyltransferase [Cynara cardunculus var. scolymus]|uniref:Alpha 1,4-glycosyltransferase domain-containing protein n=1 Tax=Cynara cardunculus var. scolymus TaxID=59895 RepID=A0A103XQ29_CYNCS|nr:lactosylceramide 4-alpha-galactosyltransferase [Cynara cardunculus var. scolymus]KVH94817.1 Alpha 1,4-glycosyltransferase domain-containing protein [Cynara cardunculus var. scolymus]
MTKVSSSKTAEQRRSSRSRRTKFHIITTVSLIAIIFTYMFNTNTFISNISFNFTTKNIIPLQSHLLENQTFIVNQLKSTSTIHDPVLIVKEVIVGESDQIQNPLLPPINLTKKQRISWFKNKLPEFDILKSNKEFEVRAREFLKECKVRFFMTWISSPFRVFGEREFLAVDALFKSNPDSCLMILSTTIMDIVYGFRILKPIVDRGFRVQAITPDLNFLFENTPAKSWFVHIKNGNRDPGEIPLAQNLSNLIRLVVLYKYGGVYLDTDFIPLKDFSDLQNSIGAQSANPSGNWTRLNNAVLIFDKNHPLLYKFIEEFALTFNGNKWGFNGPYLVSRVVERESRTSDYSNFSVLPPLAFYPVDWTRIGGLFRRPVNQGHRRWVEKKVVQIRESSYGVHLWNKQSRSFRIEEESIMARLISDHCVICKFFNKTQRLNHSDTLFIIS